MCFYVCFIFACGCRTWGERISICEKVEAGFSTPCEDISSHALHTRKIDNTTCRGCCIQGRIEKLLKEMNESVQRLREKKRSPREPSRSFIVRIVSNPNYVAEVCLTLSQVTKPTLPSTPPPSTSKARPKVPEWTSSLQKTASKPKPKPSSQLPMPKSASKLLQPPKHEGRESRIPQRWRTQRKESAFEWPDYVF